MGNKAQRGRRLAAGRCRHPAVHITVFVYMGVFGAQRLQLFTQRLRQHKLLFCGRRSLRRLAGLCVIRRIAAKTFHCTHIFSSFRTPPHLFARARGGLFFDGSTPRPLPSRRMGRSLHARASSGGRRKARAARCRPAAGQNGPHATKPPIQGSQQPEPHRQEGQQKKSRIHVPAPPAPLFSLF